MSVMPSSERHNELLAKYCIPSMGDYSAVGSELSAILDRLDRTQVLDERDKKYVRDKGLFELCKFAVRLEGTGSADYRILKNDAYTRQQFRIGQELRERYEIGKVRRGDMDRLMGLLRMLESGERIPDDEVLWLSEKDYFSPALKHVYHEREAAHLSQQFDAHRDPWDAVNGSSHFRKAELPHKAFELAGRVDIDAQRDKHLQSALGTTMGGAKRDMRSREEAVKLATRAHGYDPKSFHPCTLLGALYYEMGDFSLGDEWFAKAVERGARPRALDEELRSIYLRSSGVRREGMKRHLLAVDPIRYGWVNAPKRSGSEKSGHGKFKR